MPAVGGVINEKTEGEISKMSHCERSEAIYVIGF